MDASDRNLGGDKGERPAAARAARGPLDLALAALLVLAVAVAALLGWSYARTWRGLDYYQFWVVGQAVSRSGGADVYSAEGRERIGGKILGSLAREDLSGRLAAAASRRKVLETYSTPFLYTVAGALATGRYDLDHALFVLVSLACGFLGVLALCRLLRYPHLVAGAAVLILVELYAPCRSDLRVGNVNQIQLGLLAAFLWVRSGKRRPWRDAAAGAILGAAVMFKPNLVYAAAMLALSWLARRRFATLAAVASGMAASAAAAFAASSWYFGTPRAWTSWILAVRSMPDEIVPVRTGNFSLARLLSDAFGIRVAPLLAVAVLAASAACVWAIAKRRAAVEEAPHVEALEDLRAVGVGCMAYLLSAPLVWVHYHVLAIPLALLLLRPGGNGVSGGALPRRLLAALAVVLVANRPLEALIGTGLPAWIAVSTNVGALVLFGLAMFESRLPGGETPRWRARCGVP